MSAHVRNRAETGLSGHFLHHVQGPFSLLPYPLKACDTPLKPPDFEDEEERERRGERRSHTELPFNLTDLLPPTEARRKNFTHGAQQPHAKDVDWRRPNLFNVSQSRERRPQTPHGDPGKTARGHRTRGARAECKLCGSCPQRCATGGLSRLGRWRRWCLEAASPRPRPRYRTHGTWLRTP